MRDHQKSILTKFYIVAAFMTLLFSLIIFRVIDIQYLQGNKYRKISKDLTRKPFAIEANKGNVYASDGNLLATSMSKFTIRMDVMSVDVKIFDRDVVKLSRNLANFLGKSPDFFEKKLRNARKSKNRYILIAKDIGYNDYMKMKQFPIFKLGVYKGGFIAEHKTVRAHPIGKIAERTIGYHDNRGDAGIEGAFVDYLKGEDGLRWKQKIAKGQWKPINDVNEKEPVQGYDVVTTLDVNIQDITHHALLRQLEYFEADHGCAVVMETATGEIKAISNLGRTSAGKYYEKRNYAVWEAHEPGSTFKLASLMAALDDKMIDTSTVVDTEKGRIFIHGKRVEDSQRGGYGEISAARVFEVSSNVGIVKLIREHYDDKPEKFLDHLKDYGLTNKIGLPIKGEGKPIVYYPGKPGWNKISLEWMSWGYSIAVTPLQTLMLYNAVANNGEMVKPRFIKELRKENRIKKSFQKEVINPQIATPETIKKLKKVLENVVEKGTANNIYSSNFSMAGKTGTAKKYVGRHVNKKGDTIAGGYSNKRYVASFAGFFPADLPKYSCIVVIHDPLKKKGYYGATVAAPVFKEIAQKIYTTTSVDDDLVKEKFSSKKIGDQYSSFYNKIKNTETIPNVIGMPAMDAVSLLENVGLNVKIKGIGKVKKQSIKKGTLIKKGVTIILNLS
ncbi:penicillin-binding transpeptidase domain-containing protein [Flavobacteriaceae bacterium]|nr:penicillin-binding transpeptidase domain-containing protein [Flavobacteriaceae bacterium]MDB2632714.1 penicillin-binding transpeptidase domain-containing protein [Flavobacteriaceae bacterium]MDC0330899.1 penicillin-binding transpeptidase domain-containing protein [Flavobacteriaceae bacterium]MDC0636855.1 penicillin-binding transpeptidase domain-containing protein [Flavobacteriaceae bacterium]MDC3344967.1 penicillin-binding transpeptidase domain-containing protein [Flavobacteriaceae bacterium